MKALVKKTTMLLLTLIFALASVACDMSTVEKSSSGTVTLDFGFGATEGTKAITVSSTAAKLTSATTWTLQLTPTTDTGLHYSSIGTSVTDFGAAQTKSLTLSSGRWSATVCGYSSTTKTDTYLVFKGTASFDVNKANTPMISNVTGGRYVVGGGSTTATDKLIVYVSNDGTEGDGILQLGKIELVDGANNVLKGNKEIQNEVTWAYSTTPSDLTSPSNFGTLPATLPSGTYYFKAKYTTTSGTSLEFVTADSTQITIKAGNTYTFAGTIDSKFQQFEINYDLAPLTGTDLVTGTDLTSLTDAPWVQLWEDGPKFATVNAGANITAYTSSTDTTSTDNVGKTYTSDADASTSWGSEWKNPTATDIEGLMKNANWTYCSGTDSSYYVEGSALKGWKVIGKGGYTSYSIFLPMVGSETYYLVGGGKSLKLTSSSYTMTTTTDINYYVRPVVKETN